MNINLGQLNLYKLKDINKTIDNDLVEDLKADIIKNIILNNNEKNQNIKKKLNKILLRPIKPKMNDYFLTKETKIQKEKIEKEKKKKKN